MKKYRLIIPSWSPLSVDMQAETGSQYPAFIQLGGQPLYAHIVRQYESIRDQSEIVVVLPEQAYHAGGVKEVGRERYVAPMYQLLLTAGQSVCAPRLERSAVHILGTPQEVLEFDPMIKPP